MIITFLKLINVYDWKCIIFVHQTNKVCGNIEQICIAQTCVRGDPESNLGHDICEPKLISIVFFSLRCIQFNTAKIVSRTLSSIIFRIYHSLPSPHILCSLKINNDGRHLSVPAVFLFSWPCILNVRLGIYPYIFTRRYLNS